MRRGGTGRVLGAAAAFVLLAWVATPAAGARAGAGTRTAPGSARRALGAPTLVQVSSGDNWFNPDVIVVGRGGTIDWNFVGKTHHTVTDTTGMDLYDSGSLITGTFSYTFRSAGVYSFYCILHPEMSGRIHVPMKAKPRGGTRSTPFALTWASVPAPDGYVYDVQIKRPGKVYEPWQDGATSAGGSFNPDAGKGTYRFQARLRQLSSGQASLWSDTVSVSVV